MHNYERYTLTSHNCYVCLHTSLYDAGSLINPRIIFFSAELVEPPSKFTEVYMEIILIANFCGNFVEPSCYIIVERLLEYFNNCRLVRQFLISGTRFVVRLLEMRCAEAI